MIISQACKYGIRAVLYLADHGPEPLLSKQIAADLGIPSHFLAKILQDLSRHGLLLSFKGRGGGFKLARPAEEIALLEVVQAIAGHQFGEGCLLGLPKCSPNSPCTLHHQWEGIKGQILELLSDRSIRVLLEETRPHAD